MNFETGPFFFARSALTCSGSFLTRFALIISPPLETGPANWPHKIQVESRAQETCSSAAGPDTMSAMPLPCPEPVERACPESVQRARPARLRFFLFAVLFAPVLALA